MVCLTPINLVRKQGSKEVRKTYFKKTMKYSIAFKESKYVVKKFIAHSQVNANDIFAAFLEVEIKKPMHDRLFLKRGRVR